MNRVLEICKSINEEVPDDIEAKLLDEGYIDSFGVYQLLVELELAFDIEIEDDEMTYENFKSIKSICELLQSKGIVIEENKGI